MEENKNIQSTEEQKNIANEPISSAAESIPQVEQPSTLNPVRTPARQDHTSGDVHPGGPQPSTLQEMEVHHHSHESHGNPPAGRAGKNWKSYFWEFLMLFLAVFCGFLAEYQLEHKIEGDREKVYMQNMLEDLERDTAIYADYARRNAVIFDLVDTLMYLIKSPDRKNRSANWLTRPG